MKRKLFFLCFLFSSITILGACSKDETFSSQTTQETTTESVSESTTISEITSESEELTIEEISKETTTEEKVDKYADNEAYQVLMDFIKILQDEDFDRIDEVVNLYNNSVISKEQLDYILRTSEWGDIIGVHNEYNLISFNQNDELRKVLTFKIDGVQYELTAVKDFTGLWKVSISDYIVSNFQFITPGEIDVYWGETKLSRSKYSEPYEKNPMLDLYTVTCAPQDIELKFSSKGFGDFSKKILPKPSNEPYEMSRAFEEAQVNDVLMGIQSLWNNMFKDFLSGMNEEDFTNKYFSTKLDKDAKHKVFEQLKEYISDRKYTSITIPEIKKWEDNFFGISKTDVATANFSYKIKLDYEVVKKNKKGKEEVKQESITTDELFSNLRVEKAGNGYIIYEVTDEELFINK